MERMIRGGVIMVIGLVVTIGTYEAASGGGSYVVAWGAILFGGADFLIGLFQMLGGSGDTPVQEQARISALLNSMVALAVVDGELKADEVDTIRLTFQRLTEKVVEEKVVRAIGDGYLQGKIDLKTQLQQASKHMTKNALNAVITASKAMLKGQSIDQRVRDCLVIIGTSLELDEPSMKLLVPQHAAAA
jgi:hypothetical protein